MSTTTIVSKSATILQESGRMVLTILSSNTAAGVLAEKTQQALDAIDSAADTAMFTAGMYPDTATGLINTVDGEYFNVPSGDMEEFAILYLNVAGAAVEQKRFPGAPILQATLDAAAAAADSEEAAANSETAAAESAGAAATSAGLADADRIAAEAARDVAFSVASLSGVYIYDNMAAANIAAASLPELSIVEVIDDETNFGALTRYRKESGALVFKVQLDKAAYVSTVSVSGNSYTVGAGDVGKTILFDTSANCSITLPQRSSLELREGYNFQFRNKQGGAIAIVLQGSDVISGDGDVTTDSTRVSAIYLEQAGFPNYWVSIGELA